MMNVPAVFVERKNYARICILYMNASDKHLVTLMREGVSNDAYGKRDFRAWKYDEIIIEQRIFWCTRSLRMRPDRSCAICAEWNVAARDFSASEIARSRKRGRMKKVRKFVGRVIQQICFAPGPKKSLISNPRGRWNKSLAWEEKG